MGPSHTFITIPLASLCAEGKYTKYGPGFGVGDTITCFVDLEHSATHGAVLFMKNGFAKNGNWEGYAHTIPKPNGPEEALYPHVLVTNMEVKVDFTTSVKSQFVQNMNFKPWQVHRTLGHAGCSPAIE